MRREVTKRDKERSVQQLVHYLLLATILASTLLLAAGLLLTLTRDSRVPLDLPHMNEIFRPAFLASGVGLLYLGLLLLMIAPTLEVGILVYGYARSRQWQFTLVSLLVLLLLGSGLVLGMRG